MIDRQVLGDILSRAFGGTEVPPGVVEAFDAEPSVSIRLNPFKKAFSGRGSVLSLESGPDAKTDAEPKAKAGPDTGTDAEPKAKAGTDAEAGTDADAGTGAGAGAKSGPDAEAKKPVPGDCLGGEPVPWNPLGRFLPSRPVFTLDPLFHAGCYYVQDSSAMFPGYVFRQLLGDAFSGAQEQGRGAENGPSPVRVLDLCAAPGGKTTDLAASLRQAFGENFILVANEPVRQRAAVLQSNVELWGDPNVVVTSCLPAAFASLEGFFDIVVTDVPCSGEGMFRKDETACGQWSPSLVDSCSALQRKILSDVWPALRRGGLLVYSTCTFEPDENDGNVAYACSRLGAEPLHIDGDFDGIYRTREGVLLVPGLVRGEGQYCAALRRTDGPERRAVRLGRANPEAKDRDANARNAKARDSKARNAKACQPDVSSLVTFGPALSREGDDIIALPSALAACRDLLGRLRPLTFGLRLGQVKGRDFVPSSGLALCQGVSEDAFPRVEVSLEQALSFLHRDSLILSEAPKGYLVLTYGGVPLGFVKNLGNRTNNLHPLSRRIRMDII